MQSNLDHIARFNPTLNAIVEEALASADAADAAKGGHKTGPLHGCWCRRCED
jgi:Asp-tRNA(Asn)/Glu-tRNA(Gln) amidotransferase A subunit family amidase